MNFKNLSLILISLLMLAACASKRDKFSSDNYFGTYKVGEPYKVGDKEFVPQDQPEYDEVGMSSWYGSDFHGKKTANGDTYDKNSLTAAHNTLPLPSMVRITNLENNKTLIVMVNDRGPFSKGRIIDVSERAAEILGYKQKGVAKVRVQFLKGQTKRLLADLPKEKKSTFSGLFSDNSVYADNLDDSKIETSTPTPLIKDNVSNITVAQSEPKAAKPYAAANLEADDVMIAPTETAPLDPKIANTKSPKAKTVHKKAPAKKSAKAKKTAPKKEVAKEETIDTEFGPAKIVEEAKTETAEKTTPKESVVELNETISTQGAVLDTAETAPAPKEAAPAIKEAKKVEKYFIQAGTFSIKANADKAARALKPLGDVAVKNVTSGGKSLYRVRLGPLDDGDIAQAALKKVITMGHADALLVNELTNVE